MQQLALQKYTIHTWAIENNLEYAPNLSKLVIIYFSSDFSFSQ